MDVNTLQTELEDLGKILDEDITEVRRKAIVSRMEKIHSLIKYLTKYGRATTEIQSTKK